MSETDESSVVPVDQQSPYHRSICRQVRLLGTDYDKHRPEASIDSDWEIRLHTAAKVLADMIRWTETPKDADRILLAWNDMKAFTGLKEDFGVTEHLMAMIAIAAQETVSA